MSTEIDKSKEEIKDLLWEVFKRNPIGSDRQLMFDDLVETLTTLATQIEDAVLEREVKDYRAGIDEAIEIVEDMEIKGSWMEKAHVHNNLVYKILDKLKALQEQTTAEHLRSSKSDGV